jgi:hypothetical protein
MCDGVCIHSKLQFVHVRLHGCVRQEWCHQELGAPPSLAEAQRKLDDHMRQQQQGQDGGQLPPSKQRVPIAALDLVCLDQELEGAYFDHLQLRQEHTLFKE